MIELVAAAVLQLSILTTGTETTTQDYEQSTTTTETTEAPIGNGGWDFD